MEIIYFELNDWALHADYPDIDPIVEWIEGSEPNDEENNEDDYSDMPYFSNEEWVKENCLAVVMHFVDMSLNFNISAPKEWVMENCPGILDFPKFLRYEDENGNPPHGKWGYPFKKYCEENIGLTYMDRSDLV